MRALVCTRYGSPEDLSIEECDDPTPGRGELVVTVEAAGINFPDVLSIAGKYQVKTEPPFVPGNEACGIVSALGPDISKFAIGDSVIATTRGGAFAEKIVADAQTTMHLPDGLDFEQGAGFAVTYGTSYHALRQSANLQAGETVLVLGAAGGVGIAAVEIAKSMGARVIAAASSAEKLEFAKAAGADECVDYSTSGAGQATSRTIKQTVKDMTDGKGVDVVYDPVGGALAEQALRALAWHGRYLVVGFASGDIPNFPANIALLKEASIIGVWWGTWALKNPQQQMQNMAEVAQRVADGHLLPRVTEVYPLHDFKAAFAAITERRALGKVVLKMQQ